MFCKTRFDSLSCNNKLLLSLVHSNQGEGLERDPSAQICSCLKGGAGRFYISRDVHAEVAYLNPSTKIIKDPYRCPGSNVENDVKVRYGKENNSRFPSQDVFVKKKT